MATPPIARKTDPSAQAILYQIDGDDRLVCFNEEWERFARANETANLADPAVLRQSLWDFIQDRETRMIYAMMLERVREEDRVIDFSYRCDTPTQRRTLRMELRRQDGDHVLFLSDVVKVEERPAARLIDPTVARSEEYLDICSWCKRVALPTGEWVEVEEATDRLALFERDLLPQLSHGMCPDCLRDFRSRLAERNTNRSG